MKIKEFELKSIRTIRPTVKQTFFLVLALFGFFNPLPLATAQSNPQRAMKPNIVVLLADDLGWKDVGWHGSEIPTPNLDRLANTGAQLDFFYVQPVCSPTRAALMTGRYPMRHGLQVGVVRPWAQYGLPLEEQTLAQGLKSAGYATAIVGKWHLGHFQPEYLPTHRGFDHQYGHYNGAIDYFDHTRDGGFDWHRDDKVCRDEGYSTHLIADEAVRIVQQHAGKKPFFLYVPFNAVHAPHQVPEKYLQGFDALKGDRRIYAGMLTSMDEAIGRIVQAIDAAGERSNTIFFFSSDNGGPAPGKVTSNGQLRAAKGTVYEGGVRVPALIAWEGKIPAGSILKDPMHMVDLYPTLLGLADAKVDQKLPIDGLDMWQAISDGRAMPEREILLNAAPNSGALRSGSWKLIVNGGRPQQNADDQEEAAEKESTPSSFELFDLSSDPNEKVNLAKDQPQRVQEMLERWKKYRSEAIAPRSKPKPKDFVVPKVWGQVAIETNEQ
jgi:arylsulfatase A-like enzyme